MLLDRIKPITLACPGLMSSAELAEWAQIGKNAIPRITARFGIKDLTGKATFQRFSDVDVLQRILGVTPKGPEELEALMRPLQRTSWVAAVTATSVSGLSEGVRSGRLRLPMPIELYETQPLQAAPRGRRWVPSLVMAHLAQTTGPDEKLAAHREQSFERAGRNAFGEVLTDNARASR